MVLLTHIRGVFANKKEGRKVKELSEKEKVIEQVYGIGIHIPHNRIHKYLLEEGLAKEEPRKKRRRKPYMRYE